jgi:hypothetical protein
MTRKQKAIAARPQMPEPQPLLKGEELALALLETTARSRTAQQQRAFDALARGELPIRSEIRERLVTIKPGRPSKTKEHTRLLRLILFWHVVGRSPSAAFKRAADEYAANEHEKTSPAVAKQVWVRYRRAWRRAGATDLAWLL